MLKEVHVYEFALAIRSLPKSHQLILSLIYYDNLSIREAAAVMGISVPEASDLHLRSVEYVYLSVTSDPFLQH